MIIQNKIVCIENRRSVKFGGCKGYDKDIFEPLTIGKTYNDISGVATIMKTFFIYN